MKKKFYLATLALLAVFTTISFTACSDDDDKYIVKVTAVTITDAGGNPITEATVAEDGTYQINVKVQPANASTAGLIYSSSDENVATVSSTGLVTAVNPGTAVITIKTADGSITATLNVTVVPNVVTVTGIVFVDENGEPITEINIDEGSTANVQAKVLPENATNQAVGMSVSNESILRLNDGIVGLWPGTAYVFATSEDGHFTCELKVNVKLAPANQPLTPQGENHYTVDLGLPSGTLWADGNVGFSGEYQEYENGKWYYWSIIESPEDNVFTQSYYNSIVATDITEDIAGTRHDPAAMLWGGDWRMPTKEQMQELLDNCTWQRTYADDNTYFGYRVTGKNGNSIFLPYAGSCDYRGRVNAGHSFGCYWTSTPAEAGKANYLYISQYEHRQINNPMYGAGNKYEGYSIRPVQLPAR